MVGVVVLRNHSAVKLQGQLQLGQVRHRDGTGQAPRGHAPAHMAREAGALITPRATRSPGDPLHHQALWYPTAPQVAQVHLMPKPIRPLSTATTWKRGFQMSASYQTVCTSPLPANITKMKGRLRRLL